LAIKKIILPTMPKSADIKGFLQFSYFRLATNRLQGGKLAIPLIRGILPTSKHPKNCQVQGNRKPAVYEGVDNNEQVNRNTSP
jgi:hypothetical protein